MLSAIFMLATATVTIWNMYKNRTVTKLSGLTLDNIEALASEDGGGGAGVLWRASTTGVGLHVGLECARQLVSSGWACGVYSLPQGEIPGGMAAQILYGK